MYAVVKLYNDIGTLEWSTSLAAGHIANVVEKVTWSMTRPKYANAAATLSRGTGLFDYFPRNHPTRICAVGDSIGWLGSPPPLNDLKYSYIRVYT